MKTAERPCSQGENPLRLPLAHRFDDLACPFEALFWSPEFEFSEPKIADLLHDKTRLSQWMETVPDFEDYEAGSEAKKAQVPR